MFSYQPSEHIIVYPSLEKLQEYTDKIEKEDLTDQVVKDLEAFTLKTYSNKQIQYDRTFKCY